MLKCMSGFTTRSDGISFKKYFGNYASLDGKTKGRMPRLFGHVERKKYYESSKRGGIDSRFVERNQGSGRPGKKR